MKKLALNILALIAFAVTNVAPAFGQSMGTSATWIPMAPGMISDPALIMQAQANINIYGAQGNSLGQLTPGSVFETHMSRNPFHYVMNQPQLSYPAILGTAVQMPTSMGPMIPGTLEEQAMLANGMTLPANTNFYIPPADFSYEHVRAIGTNSDSSDEDINRLVEEIIFGSEKQDHDSHYFSDDGDEDRSERSSYSRPSYSSGSDFYSRTSRRINDEVNGRSGVSYAPPRAAIEEIVKAVDLSNSPFKILGPTCGCADKGPKCTFNTHKHGRNMFKGRRGKRTHDGVDIRGATGSPVIAAADGTVKRVLNNGKRGYGQQIDITHVDSFMTRYAHLSKIYVRNGQKVKKGQIIGRIGNTGASDGAHLHFETCKLRGREDRCNDANVVNPLKFMASAGRQDRQLNLSCTEAAALGGAKVQAPAPARASEAQRAARSGRATR